MKKPVDAVEKQFNDNGVFFLENPHIYHKDYEGQYIGVEIEIVVLTQDAVTPPDFAVSVVNRRGVSILFTDWDFFERNGQKILKLSAYQRVPDNISLPKHDPSNYMSFLDLCFYAGNEAIPEVYGEDVETKPRPDTTARDLGWILPSRFVDPLIDALGKIDVTLLGGNMSQALIYGPVTKP